MTADAQPESAPSYVVGLGASAGGLEALQAFFDHMQADSGLAFVVVQHLSPDHRSMMAELLARHTRMPIHRIEDGMPVGRDAIYLLPPRKALQLRQGRLFLDELERDGTLQLPIDTFFHSLAADQGPRAVAIVLSGTGSDGMRGVRAVKENGGLVIAQEEQSARFDGMPRSAISTGIVDYILAPEAMPARLVEYARTETRLDVPAVGGGDLAAVLETLRRHSGVDFAQYKPATLQRRIERRMHVNQAPDLSTYRRLIEHSPREQAALYKELLIGVTKFFRDPPFYDVLARRVIPQLFEQADPDHGVRAWVAGCATGEEGYSLAMLLLEHADAHGLRVPIKVFASDIDRDAIEFGAQGLYPESVVADIDVARLQRFFTPRGEAWQVNRQLRSALVFARHDVTRDPPFTRIDLVSCRNVLIYFEPVLQRRVLSQFHFALRPDGFLFLGASESIGDMSDRLRTFDAKAKLYQALGGPRRAQIDPWRETLRESRRDVDRVIRSEETAAIELSWQTLVADYAPAAFVVDDDGDLVHVFGEGNRWLRIQPGAATLNVLKLMPRALTSLLTIALKKVSRDQNALEYRRIQVEGPDAVVDLRLQPLASLKGSRRFVLITIVESDQPARAAPLTAAGPEDLDVQQELHDTRANLQATIEALETSNEELHATNEELLASNEELQSTNEELQSVNEELYTVNSQYQGKIQELTDLAADMDNLLQHSLVAIVFLDADLHIRRFTPAVTRVFNVMARDLGRPIEHISANFDDPEFVPDVRRVRDGADPVRRVVRTRDGSVFELRVERFRAAVGAPAGTSPFPVVASFTDVTDHVARSPR